MRDIEKEIYGEETAESILERENVEIEAINRAVELSDDASLRKLISQSDQSAVAEMLRRWSVEQYTVGVEPDLLHRRQRAAETIYIVLHLKNRLTAIQVMAENDMEPGAMRPSFDDENVEYDRYCELMDEFSLRENYEAAIRRGEWGNFAVTLFTTEANLLVGSLCYAIMLWDMSVLDIFPKENYLRALNMIIDCLGSMDATPDYFLRLARSLKQRVKQHV